MGVGSVMLSSARLMPLPVHKVLRALLLCASFLSVQPMPTLLVRPVLTLLSSGLLDDVKRTGHLFGNKLWGRKFLKIHAVRTTRILGGLAEILESFRGPRVCF